MPMRSRRYAETGSSEPEPLDPKLLCCDEDDSIFYNADRILTTYASACPPALGAICYRHSERC
jgi:hypothetical protein